MSIDKERFNTFRAITSRIFRMTMMISSKEHYNASFEFDRILYDLSDMLCKPDAEDATSNKIDTLNAFLQKDLEEPITADDEGGETKGIRLVIQEEEDLEPIVCVEKADAIVQEVVRVVEYVIQKKKEEEVVEEEEEEQVEEEAEEEQVEEVEVEVEEVVEVKEEQVEEVEVEEEEEVEQVEEVEEVEVEEEAEVEQVEEVEVEEEQVEEEEEVEVEEQEEEEEATMEPIQIGKTMYFLDTTTNHVFQFVSDEEAGEYVGKLVGGKLIRG